MSFNICVIGCGNHAVRVHGPSYRRYAELYPDTVLAACCDLDAGKAGEFKAQFGFKRAYTNIDEMLDSEKPDAVCLVVNEWLIAPLSVKVLEKGFPLMLEKPLTPEELSRIIKAAERGNVPNQVAFNRMYVPLLVKLKELADEHLAGNPIHLIQYDFYRDGRKDSDFATTAIHGISAVAYLAGSPFTKVRFSYQSMPSLGDNVANIYLECEFASGALARLNFCPVAGVVVERVTVNAADHTFFVRLPIWGAYDNPGSLIHIENSTVRNELLGTVVAGSKEMFVTNGFYAENEYFFNAVRAGRIPLNNVQSAIQIVAIADCIRQRKIECTLSN